ncbi:MAG TPA: DUF6350 family protein [Mycobacteriales bacterium]|nr:DUF6350 family protein [Mycobacteriales bacterium]
MTDTAVRRPVARPERRPAAPAASRLLPTAGAAALRLAATGLAVVLVACWAVWQAEDRSGTDLADVARSAGQLWLVAHGAPVGGLGLTPLGLVLLPLLLARGAGRRVAGAVEARPLAVAGAVALPVAVVAALVAVAASTSALAADPLLAALGAGTVVGLGALLGAGGADALRSRVPQTARPALRGAAAAVAALLSAGALLAGAALALDLGTARELAHAPEAGAVGGMGLALLGAALVPNAAVWGATWLAGPGFAVGTGTAVTPWTTELGPVPGLPLAAALPGGPPPGWAVLALAVPVLCGALGGLVLSRAQPPAAWGDVVRGAAAVGVLAGAAVGVLAALAGGPLGTGHLSAVGPAPVPAALAVALEVAAGAGALLAVRRRRTATAVADEG